MHKFEFQGTFQASQIMIGESLGNLTDYIEPRKTVIITDSNVRNYYQKRFLSCPIIEIGSGEGIKTIATVEDICRQLLELGVDRSYWLVGIGGGIVCDITGFVASIYMRGIKCGYVASTLLAAVDASVGGKTGVNLNGYKNIIGTFSQPTFVICDLMMLKTLPYQRYIEGFSELIKHAFIGDADLVEKLEYHSPDTLINKLELLEELVAESIEVKIGVVKKDETENNWRRVLNFGHTFGHAIEKNHKINHGNAVSIGMMLAVELSLSKGYIAKADRDRVKNLLTHYKLPTSYQGDPFDLIASIKKDKKKDKENIHLVFLEKIGKAMIEQVELAQMEKLLEMIRC